MKECRIEIFSEFIGKKEELIPVLQKVQEVEGYLSEEAMAEIAKFLRIPASNIYGVVTFYAQFRLHPVGKHIIKVCHGTACHVQNASEISNKLKEFLKVEDGETTQDNLFTLETVACLGCCSLAPVMMIGDETFGKLNNNDAINVINDIKRNEN